MPSYQVTIDEATYRVFAQIGQKMNCPDATTLMAMAVEALAQKFNTAQAVKANKKFIDQAADWLLHPSAFEGAEAVFGPPPGMTEDEVYSLCAVKVMWNEDPAVVTCWKPTLDQLKAIKKTGRLFIAQMCDRPNPVAVSAKNPLNFQGIELQ